MTNMSNKKTTFPVLYHRTAKGATNVWKVWAEGYLVWTEWGQQDGKMQTTSFVVTQKNVGRANETSLEEQAILEAQSLWTHKKDRKYKESLEETVDVIMLPMLAQSFKDKQDKISFPVDMQKKLNGLRCLAFWKENKVVLLSRGGKYYILPHISDELEKVLPKECFFDGEIYVHGLTLQEINKLARPTKNLNTNSNILEYHVYDGGIIKNAHNMKWIDRKLFLQRFSEEQKNLTKTMIEQTIIRKDKEEVLSYERECVREGYEGAIVRIHEGVYKFGYRSSDLLKVKSFDDAEFKIVGFKDGIGKFARSIIFCCITKDNKPFDVVPKGSMEHRKEMYKNGKSYVGEYLTVKHFGWTEDNIPFFPVGLQIRLKEDMDPNNVY